MGIKYAHIIHDIVEQGLDVKYLAYIIERCDIKQVHDLVRRLNIAEREYNYIENTAKDSLIKEVTLLPIADRIDCITKQIEEL